jgi:hypothetical protein
MWVAEIDLRVEILQRPVVAQFTEPLPELAVEIDVAPAWCWASIDADLLPETPCVAGDDAGLVSFSAGVEPDAGRAFELGLVLDAVVETGTDCAPVLGLVLDAVVETGTGCAPVLGLVLDAVVEPDDAGRARVSGLAVDAGVSVAGVAALDEVS